MHLKFFQKKLKTPGEQQPQQFVDPNSVDKKSKGNTMGGQIHSILMDEFKKAHQKMFKNGFVENEYQQQPSNDEIAKITALNNNERALEVSRYWGNN